MSTEQVKSALRSIFNQVCGDSFYDIKENWEEWLNAAPGELTKEEIIPVKRKGDVVIVAASHPAIACAFECGLEDAKKYLEAKISEFVESPCTIKIITDATYF